MTPERSDRRPTGRSHSAKRNYGLSERGEAVTNRLAVTGEADGGTVRPRRHVPESAVAAVLGYAAEVDDAATVACPCWGESANAPSDGRVDSDRESVLGIDEQRVTLRR